MDSQCIYGVCCTLRIDIDETLRRLFQMMICKLLCSFRCPRSWGTICTSSIDVCLSILRLSANLIYWAPFPTDPYRAHNKFGHNVRAFSNPHAVHRSRVNSTLRSLRTLVNFCTMNTSERKKFQF